MDGAFSIQRLNMIDITQADAYFAALNHTQASLWGSYGRDARAGAIAEAKRIITRALRRALDEELAAYEPGDTARDDFAVFEQALFLLKTNPVTISGGSSPYPAAVPVPADDAQAKPEETYAGGLCKTALVWLGIPAVVSVRG